MAVKSKKPEFRRESVGIEAEAFSRDITEDLKRQPKPQFTPTSYIDGSDPIAGSIFSLRFWLRFLVVFLVMGGVLHLMFWGFGIYEHNSHLSAGDQAALWIKLMVFLALLTVFYGMLMHYRPIRKQLRSLFILALSPVTVLCIFMIFGGGAFWGSFLPLLQFLTLAVGVGGFFLFIYLYVRLTSRRIAKMPKTNPLDDERAQKNL